MSDEYPQLDPDRVPRHVGLIMDGNGRWAEAALFDVVDGALDLGVGWLTAYTFSTENWKRSEEEVQFLLHFNVEVLQRRRNSLHSKGVRIRFIGDRHDPRVHQGLRDEFAAAEDMTKDNGRAEIARAVRALAAQVSDGDLDPSGITEAAVASQLAIADMPDADLLIRSSGEQRVSNFLMWQAAYAELVVSPLMWPEFNKNVFADCIAEYQARDRRFGAAD